MPQDDVLQAISGPWNEDLFHKLILRYHPDKVGDDASFKLLVSWRDKTKKPQSIRFSLATWDFDLAKSFKVTNPIYEGHTSTIFELNEENVIAAINARCSIKTSGAKYYLKVVKDPRLNSMLSQEIQFLTHNKDNLLGIIPEFLRKPRHQNKRDCYIYAAVPCFTIAQIKEKRGEVEEHHIPWMYKRILEGLSKFHAVRKNVYAPISEHIAFRPSDHGLYFFGAINMATKKVPSCCPKPVEFEMQHQQDIKTATESLLQITPKGPFSNFLENIGPVGKIPKIEKLYDEFNEFAAKRIEKKFYEFVV